MFHTLVRNAAHHFAGKKKRSRRQSSSLLLVKRCHVFVPFSFHFPQRLPPVTSFKWLCVHLSYIDTSILICLIFPSHVSLNCGIFLHGCLRSVTFYLQHFVAGVSFLFLRELRRTFLPFQSHRLYASRQSPSLSFPPSAPLRVL